MHRLRAENIVRGNVTASPREHVEAFQMLIDDGSIWHMAHSEGYSLGRRASELINKGVCQEVLK